MGGITLYAMIYNNTTLHMSSQYVIEHGPLLAQSVELYI